MTEHVAGTDRVPTLEDLNHRWADVGGTGVKAQALSSGDWYIELCSRFPMHPAERSCVKRTLTEAIAAALAVVDRLEAVAGGEV